jgi:hypothetical protein
MDACRHNRVTSGGWASSGRKISSEDDNTTVFCYKTSFFDLDSLFSRLRSRRLWVSDAFRCLAGGHEKIFLSSLLISLTS